MNCSGAALLRFDGQLRLMWWFTLTLAQKAVARGLTPSPRTLVVQADTSSSLKLVAALVGARVSIPHANASLFKVAATLGGFFHSSCTRLPPSCVPFGGHNQCIIVLTKQNSSSSFRFPVVLLVRDMACRHIYDNFIFALATTRVCKCLKTCSSLRSSY